MRSHTHILVSDAIRSSRSHGLVTGARSAFTLIEMLVVILILAALMAIAIPTFLNQRERGWDTSTQSNLLNTYKNARSIIAEDDDTFPSSTVLAAALATAEPQFTYVPFGASGPDASDQNKRIVVRASSRTVTLSAKSKSGRTYTLTASNRAGNTTGVFATEVLRDRPLGWWRMNEPGDSPDFGSSGSNIQETNTSRTAGGLGNERKNLALVFDGATTVADVPTFPTPTFNEMSIEMLVRIDSFTCPGSGGNCYIVDRARGSLGGYAAYIFNPSRQFVFGTSSDGNYGFAISTQTLVAGRWYHLVGTRSNLGDYRVYVDGILAGTQCCFPTQAPAPHPTFPLRIGRKTDVVGDYFRGPIDEVAIYDTALSQARVTAHARAALEGK